MILFNLTLFLSLRAQSYSAQQIELAERLHSLAKNAPPELAYIQTSKDIYETGEDLWFKVYLLDAQYLIPSMLSKTLYLQLLNESTKKAVWQEKYEIENGCANGQVYIDNNLPEGNYVLAAYTQYSFFGDTTEFYAVRRIKVVTDITSWKESLVISVSTKINSIQFTTFPEGGNLVSGIQCRMAFKAVKRNGEPVDIKGSLFEDNSPLLELKSIHSGMGSFIFTPDNNKKYFIRLSEPAIDSIFPLPEIYSSGMTMQLIKRDKESLSFKVSQSPERNEEDIYLRVQCRGEVYGMTTARLNKDIMIKVPLSGLPQGIAEITLFNSSLEPIAERLVYVNKDKKLNITTELSKEIYPTRGKSTLKITVKDEKGQPVIANLGVSVFDKLYQNPRDSNNILVHYYLSTQLKGKIYNPSFYFNNTSAGQYEALDLLMLTQGWRKYLWNETNLKKFNKEPQKVIFDGIRGEIYIPDRKKKILKEQIFVMAFSPNKDRTTVLIPTDSVGNFIISPDHLKKFENENFYLKPAGPPQFRPLIKLTDPFNIIDQEMKVNEIIYPDSNIIVAIDKTPVVPVSSSKAIIIKEVTIRGQKTNAIRGKYMGTLDSLAKLHLSSDFSDYVCRFNVLNCPNHGPNEQGTTKPVEGKRYFVPNGASYSEIVYHSTNFALTEEDLLKEGNLSRVKAYYGKREFYQPNYDQDKEDSIVPDFRNTLLWEPSVLTDEKGEATLSFFCSDINTDFVGRIEGVSGQGLLGNANFKFTVRKLKPAQ
jgi:hypothetical protein